MPGWLNAAVTCAGVLTIIILLRLLRSVKARLAEKEALWGGIISAVEPGLDFDESAGRVLELVASIVDAPGYYLYLVSEGAAGRLILRSIRSEPEGAKVGIHYSSFGGDFGAYEAPLIHEPGQLPGDVGFEDLAGYSLVAIPIHRQDGRVLGVVHAGPVRRDRVSRKSLALLREFKQALCNAVSVMFEKETIRRESGDLENHLEAVSIAAKGAYEPQGLVETLVSLGSGLAGSEAWLLVAFEGGRPSGRRPMIRGIPDAAAGEVTRRLSAASGAGIELPGGVEVVDLASWCGGALSPLLSCSGVLQGVWAPLAHDGRILGALICLLNTPIRPETHKLHAIGALATGLAAVVENLQARERISASYLKTLKSLVMFMDTQDVHTRGHSARVARFTREIAVELDLAPRFREAVEIAGYLHDVGMCALRSDLIYCSARFTQAEYEEMKAHATVGAALVEPIVDPESLAPMVRHHHERYDGWGYPSNLKGEAIPLGARIIAVADVFNAKITNRDYRRAMDFTRAIAEIEKAKGTMLDPKCVDALLSSIRRKQMAPGRTGRTLEPCWEMIQCPEFARDVCPAGDKDCNCWSVSGVRCSMHGDECEYCMVFTEFKNRADLVSGAGGRD